MINDDGNRRTGSQAENSLIYVSIMGLDRMFVDYVISG